MSNYNSNPMFDPQPRQPGPPHQQWSPGAQQQQQQPWSTGPGQYPFAAPQSAPPGGGPKPPKQGKKNRGLLIALIAVGVLLVAGGGVGAYLYLRPDDTGTIEAQETQSPGGDSTEGGGAAGPCDLSVESLGATIPSPGDDWAAVESASGEGYVSVESKGCEVQHDGSKSYIESGVLSPDTPYDPADLGATAAGLATDWGGSEHIAGAEAPGKALGSTETRETEFNGHPAALATLRVTWDQTDGLADTYQDVSVLIVDFDGSTALVVLASIPQSGEALNDQVTQAILDATFAE